MARGFPTSQSTDSVAPLPDRRIRRAKLARIAAFRSEQERERKDGEKYTVEVVQLSLFWDSHKTQTTVGGDPVIDEETGELLPHYINEGFITLSGAATSNFVKKILPALGFTGPEFIQQDGQNKGNLTDATLDSLEVKFGSNKLGDDYEGADWTDLPMYERGGKTRKGDLEVEVLSLKLAGHELLGREVDLALDIKDGWNRVNAYLLPEDFAGLDNEPLGLTAADGGGKPEKAAAAKAKTNRTATTTEAPTTKQAKYVAKVMEAADIPPIYQVDVLRHILSDPHIMSVAGISAEHANTLKALWKDGGSELFQDALAAVEATPTELEGDDDDEEWDDDVF